MTCESLLSNFYTYIYVVGIPWLALTFLHEKILKKRESDEYLRIYKSGPFSFFANIHKYYLGFRSLKSNDKYVKAFGFLASISFVLWYLLWVTLFVTCWDYLGKDSFD